MSKRIVTIQLERDTCDVCGKDAPDHAYDVKGWSVFQNIICYGWRRNVNHDIGISKTYIAHDSCVAMLIKKYQSTPVEPNKPKGTEA